VVGRMPCLIILPVVICLACGDRGIEEEEAMEDRNSALGAVAEMLPPLQSVPKAAWQKLAGKTIFFGHHSVGYNILDGVRDISAEDSGVQLEIVETSDPEQLQGGVFAHARVGKNQDPIGKIREFERVMDSGLAAKSDIAFFKFCYVDFYQWTDIEPIFDLYQETMRSLATKYPDTDFVYVTVPLKSKPRGFAASLKEIVKSVLGKPTTWQHNRRRNQFNDRIRSSFGASGHVYDLALVESTLPDGSRRVGRRGDDRVPELALEYTTDGGHLNEKGRRHAAEQLLILLASVADELGGDESPAGSRR